MSKWMAISGATGFVFFLTANFTSFFSGSAVIAGLLQLAVNIFVFFVWKQAFQERSGFMKFIAFWGVVVPISMASITLIRVLIPWFLSH